MFLLKKRKAALEFAAVDQQAWRMENDVTATVLQHTLKAKWSLEKMLSLDSPKVILFIIVNYDCVKIFSLFLAHSLE